MRTIPPFRLVAEPLNDEAASLPQFRWAAPEIGKRHRLGGEPEFIQPMSWPRCEECGAEMTFYAQIDSLNDDILIADCGMVYVFVCFECVAVKSVIQSA